MTFSRWADVYSERARQFDNPLDICEFYSGPTHFSDEWFKEATEFIASSLQLQPQDRILEVGCGCGVIMRYLFPNFRHFVGVDLSYEVVDIARRALPDVTFHVASAVDLPLDDGSFDKCFCYQSLHYFDEFEIARRAILEMGRILRKGGRILIGQIPNAELEADYQVIRGDRKFRRDNRVAHDLRWLWFSPDFFESLGDQFRSIEIRRGGRAADAMSKYRMDVIITV